MPGKQVTDHQVIKYKQYRQRLSQEAAAAKVGISERTARRLERLEGLPSQRAPRTWRTRTDPLSPVWDTEVLPMLQAAPGLTAVTVLEELPRRPPRRVLERRAADPAATRSQVARARGSGARGVLRPAARARPVGPVRLHPRHRALPVHFTQPACRTAIAVLRRVDQPREGLDLLRCHQEQQLALTHLDLPFRCQKQPHRSHWNSPPCPGRQVGRRPPDARLDAQLVPEGSTLESQPGLPPHTQSLLTARLTR